MRTQLEKFITKEEDGFIRFNISLNETHVGVLHVSNNASAATQIFFTSAAGATTELTELTGEVEKSEAFKSKSQLA